MGITIDFAGQLLNGVGVPAPSLGNVGDFYIDTASNYIYGPKTVSGWGSGTSIVGPSGGSTQTVRYISSSDTAQLTDQVIIFTGSSPATLNMVDFTGHNGQTLIIKNFGTGTLTVDAFGAHTIDGTNTIVMSRQGLSVSLVSTNGDFIIC